MTAPLWVSILVALIAGFFAAIVTPLVSTTLARRNWQRQKTFELKYEVFRGAIGALASWATDALDVSLQSSKTQYKGISRKVEMRAETAQALAHYKGLVEAMFSTAVVKKFDEVVRAPISIDEVPCLEFEEKRLEFVKAASQELGIQTKEDA